MKRREFVRLLGSAAVSAITSATTGAAAHAQAPRKLPTIGFLGPTSAAVALDRISAFEERLRQHGWMLNQTVSIEYRWADGNTRRFSELARELVRDKVDVIVTWGTATAIAVKQATSVIPIVFTVVGDPVGSGLVVSLARPGGNVTGLSSEHPDSVGKRLEFLREIVPNMRRLAILANSGNPGAMEEMRDVDALARKLGIVTLAVKVREAGEFGPAIGALKNDAGGLYVTSDALMNTNRAAIDAAALAAHLPTVAGFESIVRSGGLLCYAPDYPDLFRGAADYADKILRGAKPAELPVEQPTKFDLVINLKTAKALGLTIPPTLLVIADEVIE